MLILQIRIAPREFLRFVWPNVILLVPYLPSLGLHIKHVIKSSDLSIKGIR